MSDILYEKTRVIASTLADRLIAALPRHYSGPLRRRLIPDIDAMHLDGDVARLERTRRELYHVLQAPWLPVVSQFEALLPDDLTIRHLDRVAILPRDLVSRTKSPDEQALARAEENTARALEMRMEARIDLALRGFENDGHCLVPLDRVMDRVRQQIRADVRIMSDDQDADGGQVRLAFAGAGDAPGEVAGSGAFGLDVNLAEISKRKEFTSLFVASFRSAVAAGRMAGRNMGGKPHIQRGATALAERRITDFVAIARTVETSSTAGSAASAAFRAKIDKLAPLARAVAADEKLSGEQKNALHPLLAGGFGILTGGPGTGKTHTVARLVAGALHLPGIDVQLVAPTGKAAARMNAMLSRLRGDPKPSQAGEEAGAPKARTIHSLLQARPDDPFGYNFMAAEQVAADLLVIDESSMIDVHLMKRLLDNVDPARTAVLLVGDPDQIPPVGPGQPFADIVAANGRHQKGAGMLTQIHRQAEGNPVIALARRIQAGKSLQLAACAGNDATAPVTFRPTRDTAGEEGAPDVKPVTDVTQVVDLIRESCRAHGLDPTYDAMTVSPQYDGPLGVIALNQALKAAFNPGRDDEEHLTGVRGVAINIGDRVIMTRRNLIREGIMNGDGGVLVDLNVANPDPLRKPGSDDLCAVIDMGTRGRPDFRHIRMSDTSCLDLGYAITAHRAQGDEAALVTVIGDARNRSMLNRNLVYTAVTRTRDRLIVIGDADKLDQFCRRPPEQRLGWLSRRLEAIYEARRPEVLDPSRDADREAGAAALARMKQRGARTPAPVAPPASATAFPSPQPAI